MRIHSIDIKNFRVIKEASLVFPDTVIGIIGPNGSGKSSIVEAIAWALYGNQAARTGKEEIKASFCGVSDTCEVSLKFSINEERYHVIRSVSGKTDRVDVKLYRGDNSESVGVNETKHYIGELLGLDWRGFLSSFLARQQELNALSDLAPAKRKDHLAGMLGIEKLDKAIKNVKQDVKGLEGKNEVLEKQVLSLPQIIATIEELSQKIADRTQLEIKLKEAFNEKNLKLKEITGRFQDIQSQKERWIKLVSTLEAEQKTKNNIIENISNLESEIENLVKAEIEKNKLLKETVGYQELKLEIDKLKDAKAKAELAQQLKKQKTAIESELNLLSSKKQKVLDDKSSIITALAEIPENVNAQYEELKIELEKSRDKYTSVKAEKDSLQRDLEKVEKQLRSINKLGGQSVCDRCLRPLGDDLDEIKTHINKEKDLLVTSIASLTRNLEAITQKGSELKKETEKLAQQVKQQADLRKDSIRIDDTLAETEKNLISKNTQYENLLGEISKHPSVEFDPEKLNEMQIQLSAIGRKLDRINQIEGALKRLPESQKALGAQKAKEKQIGISIEKINIQIEQLNFSEELFQDGKISFENAQNEFEQARQAYEACKNEIQLIKMELQGKIEYKENLKRVEEDLDKNRSIHFHLEKLSNLFGEYRTQLISRIRPTLAEISGNLISEMTAGKYNMVELDDKYNLQILDYGSYFGVERFSGGEKDLANLCLRLAISISLTQAAGMARSFIILDEVFGSQDNERRELIIKSLSNLKNRFPQIILITHLEDIKDRVETLIQLEPTSGGWSEIRMNHREEVV